MTNAVNGRNYDAGALVALVTDAAPSDAIVPNQGWCSMTDGTALLFAGEIGSTFPVIGGIARTHDGLLCVTSATPGTDSQRIAGLAIRSDGAVHVSSGPVTDYVGGVGIDANGAMVVSGLELFNFETQANFDAATEFIEANGTADRTGLGMLYNGSEWRYGDHNFIRNNTMVGAAAGSAGTLPTNWSTFTSLTGLTRTLALGSEGGMNYIDVTLSGTPSGAGTYSIYFDTTTGIAALTGQVWTNSAFMLRSAGSAVGVSQVVLAIDERTAAGAFIAQRSSSALTLSTSNLAASRQAFTTTLAGGGTTAYALPYIQLTLTGVEINITLRIGLPCLVRGSNALTAVETTTAARYLARQHTDPSSNVGWLIEPQRTNSIRNNTMQGAVAGTPGTNPTNWTIVDSNGLTKSIVGVGTENGVAYVDVRYAGTASSGSGFNFVLCEPITQIVAAQGQTWATSVFVKLVGGTLNNIALAVVTQGRTAAGSLVEAGSTAITPTAADLGTQRYSSTRTMAGATVERVTPAISATPTNGQDVDITLRIGLPQLELGANASSPIETTDAAVTRTADLPNITDLTAIGFNAVEGTIVAKVVAPDYAQTSEFARIATFNDGTTNNEFYVSRSSGRARAFVTDGGVQQANLDIAAWANSAVGTIAMAYKANDIRAAFNGSTPTTDTSATLPTVDRLSIGATGTGVGRSMLLQSLSYYPRALPDAQLQAITA